MEQAKGNTVSGTTLAQYVHDAVEVERPICELEGRIWELKKKLADNREAAKQAAEKAKVMQSELERSSQNPPKIRAKKEFPKDDAIRELVRAERKNQSSNGFTISVVLILVFAISAAVAFCALSASGESGMPGVVGIFIVATISILVAYSIHDKNAYRKAEEIVVQRIQVHLDEEDIDIDEENRCTLADWEKHNKQLAAELENIDELEKTRKQELADGAEKIKELESQLAGLQAGREKFYEAGLIPPDYRTFEHVSGLDAIFRNGRADDMRQALEIYEETLFREEIKQAASRMQSSISAIYINLNSVGRRLDDLKGALAGVSESNRQAAELNKRMLYEAQMNRAAAEELRRNSEEAMRYASEAQRAAREEAEKNDKLRRQISDAQWEAREEARKNDELRRKISDHLDDN